MFAEHKKAETYRGGGGGGGGESNSDTSRGCVCMCVRGMITENAYMKTELEERLNC